MEKSNVKIIIFNAIGEEVAVVLNEEKETGYHHVEFDLPPEKRFNYLIIT